jgi:hypothetical protein
LHWARVCRDWLSVWVYALRQIVRALLPHAWMTAPPVELTTERLMHPFLDRS